MISKERFNAIVGYLRLNGRAALSELSELNKVSTDTVRRDLLALEEQGVIKRVRGGAVILEDDPTKMSYGIRSTLHQSEKRALCSSLCEVVREGQTVAINNGTTSYMAAEFLCKNYNNLTVITNSLSVISSILKSNKFNVIVPGGMLDHDERSLYGKICENCIRSYNIDIALLSVGAVSHDKGITDFRFNEIGVIDAMLASSDKKFVLADSSKLEKVSCINVCKTKQIDGLLTDSLLNDNSKNKLEKAGLKLYIS